MGNEEKGQKEGKQTKGRRGWKIRGKRRGRKGNKGRKRETKKRKKKGNRMDRKQWQTSRGGKNNAGIVWQECQHYYCNSLRGIKGKTPQTHKVRKATHGRATGD